MYFVLRSVVVLSVPCTRQRWQHGRLLRLPVRAGPARPQDRGRPGDGGVGVPLAGGRALVTNKSSLIKEAALYVSSLNIVHF